MKVKALAEDDESLPTDLELKEEYFKSLELTEADGVRTVTASLDPEKVEALFGDLLGSGLLDSLGGTEEEPGTGPDMQVKAVDMTAKLGQDDLLHEVTASISIAVSVEGPSAADPESTVLTEMQCDMSVTVTFNNPGAPVTVTPPADLEEYEDFTMDEGDFV